MAAIHSDKFKRDAVGIARTYELTRRHVGFAMGKNDTQLRPREPPDATRIAKSRLLGARWPATLPLFRQILTVAGMALVCR
jgi:hypothetical protein